MLKICNNRYLLFLVFILATLLYLANVLIPKPRDPLQIYQQKKVGATLLCRYKEEKSVKELPPCPQTGIVTVKSGGRLGNQMWEYASVWAVARKKGLEPYVPYDIRLNLEKMFEALSIPSFETVCHCRFYLNTFVDSPKEWTMERQNILLRMYVLEIDLVVLYIEEIVKEFSFKPNLLEQSQMLLRVAADAFSGETSTFVSVHVRRTDYIGYVKRRLNEKAAGVDFYRSAMEVFERKYQNVLFIVVSDDPGWSHKQFSYKDNIYVVGLRQTNSPALDLAILASCNHSIFDYGTYGQWGALLAGGETIYYNLTKHATHALGELLPNWYTIG